jgi:hypothetical protein
MESAGVRLGLALVGLAAGTGAVLLLVLLLRSVL